MARLTDFLLIWGTLAIVALAACSSPSPEALNGRLVFERKAGSNSDIFAMAVDGSGLVQLTDALGWDGEPSWSPDGSQIVFASDRGGGPAIYVMNADGSDPRPLTEPSYASLTPAWSPDGQRIAFAAAAQSGRLVCELDDAAPAAAARAGAGAHTIHFAVTADGGGDRAGVSVREKSTFVVPR